MPSQDTDWHRTSFSTVAIVSITSSSVKVKAELLAFDYRQRAADIDLAENAFAALGIALPLRPACGDGSKGIRDNLFSMGHENLHRNVPILFSFCDSVKGRIHAVQGTAPLAPHKANFAVNCSFACARWR
jgi:hypothetical protein